MTGGFEQRNDRGFRVDNRGDFRRDRGDYRSDRGDYRGDRGDYRSDKGDYKRDKGSHDEQEIYSSKQPTEYVFKLPTANMINIDDIPENKTIINTYNISLDPFESSGRIKSIYEDQLPFKYYDEASINERLKLYHYIKSIIPNLSNNYELPNIYNIMSHFKLTEFNPQMDKRFTNNPYGDLPSNLLIFKSCYPIESAKTESGLATGVCADNGVNVNIRIYDLLLEEYFIGPLSSFSFKYDVWREIAYYDYILVNIIKSKICPNFIIMMSYFITEQFTKNFNRKNKNPAIKRYINDDMTDVYEITQNTSFANKTLIVITESPFKSLYSYLTKSYEVVGNIYRMVHTGFVDNKIWMTLLFQILIIFYIFQKHHIGFCEIKLSNNFYIKEIDQGNHWRYVIDGIVYYVPNYGKLLLFDSSFADIQQPEDNNKIKYKLYMETFADINVTNDIIDKVIMGNLKNVINPNNFTREFINNGGIQPQDEIIDILTGIHTDVSTRLSTGTPIYVKDYIEKYFTRYMNNRIGTFIKDTELLYISDKKIFQRGEMILYPEASSYKWGLIKSIDGNDCSILCDNKNTLQQKNLSGIFAYHQTENIEQTFKPNEPKLSNDAMIEMYIV